MFGGVVFAAAVAMGSKTSGQTWQPSVANVAVVESRLVLPSANPITAYARYYTGRIVSGHHILEGYYLSGFDLPPGIYLKPADVIVADGGCAVITLHFDLEADKVVDIICNGVA